jgi:oxygen-independent coproporphyrinogen-3 oxidase
MFGFPGETIADWQSDIHATLALGVEHISAYSLMYEEGTTLHHMSQTDPRYAPVSEELSLAMYHLLIDSLQNAGYEHYEISNFALPSFRSRHNSNYWQAVPYLGLGAAAHSYDLDTRSWNVSDVQRYINLIESGQLPTEEREQLTTDDRFDDMVMTRLRTCEGISIAATRRDFGPHYAQYLLENAQKHIALNRLAIEGDHLHLTREGLFLSDSVMSDLMHV